MEERYTRASQPDKWARGELLWMARLSGDACIDFECFQVGDDQRGPGRLEQVIALELAKDAGHRLTRSANELPDLTVCERAGQPGALSGLLTITAPFQ